MKSSPLRVAAVQARRGLLVFEGFGTDSVQCTLPACDIGFYNLLEEPGYG